MLPAAGSSIMQTTTPAAGVVKAFGSGASARQQRCRRNVHRHLIGGRQQGKQSPFSTAVAAMEEVAVTSGGTDLDEDELDKDAMYKRFEELLSSYDFAFKTGDRVTGTIFRVDGRGAYVDIGAKGAAFCPVAEISQCKVDRASSVLEPETTRDFIIVREDRNGELTLSIKKIEASVTWARVRQMQEEDVTVAGTVVSVNRGGILVEFENLRGFVPSSHLAATNKASDDLLGASLPCKFLEVDEERFRLVLSNRRAVSDSAATSFSVGDVVVGVVQSVKPYGAFVDLGGVNGLLHISQISHDRISSVETVLAEGDTLKVMILSQDRDRGRVALSTKKLEPTPGDMLRDPALVYERAEEMAAQFKQRVAAAEAAARSKGGDEAGAPVEQL